MLFQPDPSNDNQVLIPQSRFCESSHMWYFAGVLFAVKGSNILLIQIFVTLRSTRLQEVVLVCSDVFR